jgi:superfamily I DNA/RNA helicase
MKYIALDYNSVKAVISERKLQSAEYEAGKKLSDIIKTTDHKSKELLEVNASIKINVFDSGIFVVSKDGFDPSRLLVFDTTTFSGFSKNDNEVITIIQKTCRYAIKHWQNISLSPCEKIITGSTYTAVMPFSFSAGETYKIIIDRSPDKRRQDIRGNKSLLVFHDGFKRINSEPILSNFRIAEKDASSIKSENIFNEDNKSTDDFIEISNTGTPEKVASPHMGMEYWHNNLTENQKSFVFSQRMGPDILKGAAGTGKTLCLVLRCINQLNQHKATNKDLKSVFFTHSIATKQNIENLFVTNGGESYLEKNKLQHVQVTTLQEWCIENLKGRIETTEYLDKDALESKTLQLLYISDAYEKFKTTELKSSEKFISIKLSEYFNKNDDWIVSSHLQYEISTYIKGQSGEDFDTYKEVLREKTSIPLTTEEDYKTIWMIFNFYQSKLIDTNIFDSDDITISALAEMNSPIWRRRRKNEGFDILYIDETHLFNFNELSLFHNLLKTDSPNIVFTIDRAQGIGDKTLSSDDVKEISRKNSNYLNDAIETKFSTVFRCSPDILKLAECMLASGVTLFSHLENPLSNSVSIFTNEEEVKFETPYYINCLGSDEICKRAIEEVSTISDKVKTSKSNIAIICCAEEITSKMKEYADVNGLNCVFIEKRGDSSIASMEKNSDFFVISEVDYVGGLEFDAVVILGVDKGKFPRKGNFKGEAAHFITYSSINKLYVAITRAKYICSFLVDKSEGISPLLSNAIEQGFLIQK